MGKKTTLIVSYPKGKTYPNSIRYHMNLPKEYVNDMGFTPEDKKAIITYDRNKKSLTLEKDKDTEDCTKKEE